jgi:predicted transcriptional regulator
MTNNRHMRDEELAGGWRPDDEPVYLALISFPAQGAAALASRVDRPQEDVEAAVRRLSGYGLIHRDEDGRLVAVPPEPALGPRLARERERLRANERLLADLAETYHREAAPAMRHDLVELIEGGPAQAHRLLQLEYGAERVIRSFQSGSNTAVAVRSTVSDADLGAEEVGTAEDAGDAEDGGEVIDPVVAPAHSATDADGADRDAGAGSDAGTDGDEDDFQRVRTRARPGVAYRVVVDRAYLEEPAAPRVLEQHIAEGWDVRVVDRPLRKLAIADEQIAMMQLTADTSALLKRPLVALAVELFESTWESARPYLIRASDLGRLDRQILQLMLAGLTDHALAHQLGISPRTVQRRLQSLMTTAGATTRMQLGWHAFRRGWV